MVPLVFAQSEDRVTASIEAGSVGHGSGLYGLDLAFDELSVVLAGNDEAKALMRIRVARERLAEAEDNFGDGKLRNKALDEHNKQLAKIGSDSDVVKDALSKHLVVLERVRVKLVEKGNDTAAQAVGRAINKTSGFMGKRIV